jgi:hypothetical protein
MCGLSKTIATTSVIGTFETCQSFMTLGGLASEICQLSFRN